MSGHGGQPLGPQLLQEHRTVDAGLAFAEIDSVLRIGDSIPGAIRVKQGSQRVNRTRNEPSQWSQVVQTLLIDEHLRVRGGQTEPALECLRILIVDGEDPGHRLLFEPLADISLRRARARREVR